MRILLLLLALTVAACGGGGGGSSTQAPDPPPPPDAKPGGFYTGSFTSDVTGETLRVDGLVLETGEAVLLSLAGIYTTQLEPDEDRIDAEFEAFALFGGTWDGVNTYLHGNIEGAVSERSGINGEYTLGSDSGTFSLTYKDEQYEHPSSATILEGDWGYTVPANGYTITVQIDSQGRLSGSDTDGCVYAGSISTVDTEYNAYRVSDMDVTCPYVTLSNGAGVAHIIIDSEGREGLEFGVRFAEKLAWIDYWLTI